MNIVGVIVCLILVVFFLLVTMVLSFNLNDKTIKLGTKVFYLIADVVFVFLIMFLLKIASDGGIVQWW